MSRYIVGLTGGIGSGKSAAAAAFAAHDISVIDADAIAHALTATHGGAIEAIRASFGNELISPDGSLDRAAMRNRVFADAGARKQLEGILHPMIRSECARLCASAPSPYAVLMVPLLVESGNYRERINRLAVVDCPEEMQIARVMARSQLERAEILRIMATQATRAERLAAADDVIENSGTLAALTTQIDHLHERYRLFAQNC